MKEQFDMVGHLELRYITKQPTPRPKLSTSSDLHTALEMFAKQSGLNIDFTEYIIVVCMSRCGKLIGCSVVSEGGTSCAVFPINKIMSVVMLSGASVFAIAHNHPQSNRRPSNLDKEVTQQVLKAANILDLKFIDHIILADYDEFGCHTYFSFNDEGLL